MWHRVVPVAFVLLGAACTDRTPPAPAGPQPAPPGWEETRAQGENLRYEDGKGEEAVSLFERVVASTPGFPGGHFELGASLREAADRDYGAPMEARTPRFEKAIEHFRRAMDLGYQPRGDAREQISQIQVRLFRFAEVEKEGRAWVAEEPGNPSAWWTLAGAVVTLKRPDEATRLMLDAGPKIGNAQQVEYAKYLAWVGELPLLSGEQRKALLDAAQAIVDKELAANRTSADLDIVRARILKTTAEHLERDPSRQRALQEEADRLLTAPR